ncbi:PEP/pyruvate-binding domain-containing protein [Desulfobacula toluolica]|uniref:Predicted pyruvate phosphate dikinase, PEP/pyruvate-binding n=1 Tax=Desulfobacula toluolica (strain DSM 7467 / Tol2) TaxID=651182 RepID=K0NT33_DESTT|nr:PEP/pyruvate-binding domain-containing protein [Desulfobacula toluolica]CCK82197.1 predicted pyruvate phosphate dikinase, PEP/pyruvate-binding [Desulfobacula toluolica Tol2]
MNIENNKYISEFHARSEVFRKLMAYEIKEILLIASLYDMYNMEESGSLTSKIVNEYNGMNLSHPPSVSGVSSVEEALSLLRQKEFDMVLIVPHLEELDLFSLGKKIKEIKKDLPVIIISPSIREIYALPENVLGECIDNIYIWSGNSDLFIALIKNAEDHLNVDQDTKLGNTRVLILVEDSPDYYSFFLPIIYKEIVTQTQALLKISLNDNLKLLTMRARPKVLLARNYEEAIELYEKYRSFLLCVISDTRFPRNGETDPEAGIALLSKIKNENRNVPLLLISSESENREKSDTIPAVFIDKNSSTLSRDMHEFFQTHLGFGDFVFCLPDKQEIDRAENLLQLGAKLPKIPKESIAYHADRDHFSNWLMARFEIDLALKFRAVKSSDFNCADELRQFILSNINELRKKRQKGIVSKFNRDHFDPNIREFVKIGQGSLGGKGRGLAFVFGLLSKHEELQNNNSSINIKIPRTMVICTDIFDDFVAMNNLQGFSKLGFTDDEVKEGFLNAQLPEWLIKDLEAYLAQVDYPLAVRSSNHLEDASFSPSAGLYKTYKLPNNHASLSVRLDHMIAAIKLVYASVYSEDAKLFSLNGSNQPFTTSMAVIVQEIAGDHYGDYFYPAISGVAQSYNFYPFSRIKPEDGVAHFALGLGKTVVEGGKSLRFSPKYPNIIPEFSSVENILQNTQNSFYALKINNNLNAHQHLNLEKRTVNDANNEFPVQTLASTYVLGENRIRDTWDMPGPKVLTFARILKYNMPPISGLLTELLAFGSKSFGTPVEIEFSVNLYPDQDRKTDFFFLQIRPMAIEENQFKIDITQQEIDHGFCFSSHALGNGINDKMTDIVYVKPRDFKPEATVQIAEEINRLNSQLIQQKRSYLLVGPGRWGSSDRYLGIPVKWRNISGAGAIIELRNESINADPSQGSHFFHNITPLGVHYITVDEIRKESSTISNDYFDWEWIESLSAASETTFLRHIQLEKPLMMKINGRNSQCVMTMKK